MNRIVIQIENQFAILRTDSNCAYGRFDSRAEAEEMIREANESDKAHAYDTNQY